MRMCFVLALASACGNDVDPAKIDAATKTPDAAIDAPPACVGTLVSCSGLCVNETNDMANCGACGHTCAPAASCSASACVCPSGFVGATNPVLATEMLAAQPGFVSGASAITGTDAQTHALVVTASATAPLGTPLLMNDKVFVAVAYDVTSATQSRASYLASGGTVTLTRRCANGLAGSVANVALTEVDPTTLAVIPGGCTTSIASASFDIAGPCT